MAPDPKLTDATGSTTISHVEPGATLAADSSAFPGQSPPTSERYTLGDEIARGGMGVVLHAADTVLGREVAVKVLQDKYAPASMAARRFGIEARITAQLQHPA